MLTAITGALVSGLVHVLSGPDHLAAVAPLAAADRQRGWLAGWTWGVGHAAGVMTVAFLAVILRDLLPPFDLLSAWSELIVGAALIGIGLWAFRHSLRIGAAAHVHGSIAHDHVHVQRGPHWIRRMGHAHAAFLMGVLHGIAGSSHFFGVLPALALPTRADALTYIAAFGVGSVVAMTAFAAVIGSSVARVHYGALPHRVLLTVASVAAVSVGGWWLVVGGS
jgi:hypothetical protein